MYLQNLELKHLDYDVLKSELLLDIENEPIPTLEEVKDALAEMYSQASNATAALYYSNVDAFKNNRNENFSFSLAGSNLWNKLKKFLCGFLSATSTASEIIDKIVEFIASLIPGAVFIANLVSKLAKYVLNMGYEKLCPSTV